MFIQHHQRRAVAIAESIRRGCVVRASSRAGGTSLSRSSAFVAANRTEPIGVVAIGPAGHAEFITVSAVVHVAALLGVVALAKARVLMACRQPCTPHQARHGVGCSSRRTTFASSRTGCSCLLCRGSSTLAFMRELSHRSAINRALLHFGTSPNPSIERTSPKRLRRFAAAAHVKR